MEDLEKIKTEIIEAVKNKHSDPKKIERVIQELEIMGETEGLETVNNLETFYRIWRSCNGRVGNDNKINSWTAYFLGMTGKKPTKGEGFLPARRAFARAGFPDIDTDFDDINRDKVYAYIIDKYGRNNVGNIGTHGLLKFKSCVTRVVKALDLANAYHKSNEEFITENAAKASEILSPFPKKGLMKVTGIDGEQHLIKNFEDAYEHCAEFKAYIDKYQSSGIKEYVSQTEETFANFGCLSKDTPILTDHGWVNIDKLSIEHKIAYVNKEGVVKYTDSFKSFKTGKKKIFRMKLSNGSFIDVTDEHLIFTDKGCVPFGRIRRNIKDYKIYGAGIRHD